MAWKKSSEEMTAQHEELVSRFLCEKRTMFGFQVFFVNDNMFTGMYEDGMILRLPPEKQSQMMEANDEAIPFAPQGRRMKEYVWMPETVMNMREIISEWLDVSYKYTSALLPKVKKPSKKVIKAESEDTR